MFFFCRYIFHQYHLFGYFISPGPDRCVSSSDSLPPINLAKEAVVNELQEDSVADDEVTALTSEE